MNTYTKKPEAMHYRTRNNAIKRGIDFSLTKEEYLEIISEKNCTYCGITGKECHDIVDKIRKFDGIDKKVSMLKKKFSSSSYNSIKLSVDRADSMTGYETGNCVVCCLICNITKGWAIPSDQYKLIAPAVIANIVNICKEAGLVLQE